MLRTWFVVLSLAVPVAAEDIKMYNLAVGTSVGTALAVNALSNSSAGFDYAWDSGKERGRLLLNWRLPLEQAFGALRVTSAMELALGQTVFEDEEQPMANLTPLFDWHLNAGPVDWILETGLGVAYLSKTTLGPDIYSTHWQFSEILGLGVRWRSWQVGGRYQHVSNGSVKKPNNGQDFYGFMIKYHY